MSAERERETAELLHQLRNAEQLEATIAATDVQLRAIRDAIDELECRRVAQALEGRHAHDGSVGPQRPYSTTVFPVGPRSSRSATESYTAPSQSLLQPLRRTFLASFAALLPGALVVAVVAPIIHFISLGGLKPPDFDNHRPDARSTSSEPMTVSISPHDKQRPLSDVPGTSNEVLEPESSTGAPAQDAMTSMVIQSTLPPSENDTVPVAPLVALSQSPMVTPGTTDTTATFPTPLLDLGQLDDAKRVQRRLIELGFLLGMADGNWGPRSRRALRDFRGAQDIGNSDFWDEKAQQDLFSATAVHAPATGTFAGGWGINADQCRQVPDIRSPLTISTRGAEAFGTTCKFNSIQRESANEWRIRAICINEHNRWNSNIRLTLTGRRLTWTSERGAVTYLRCPMI